jgi:hypothetical protein
MTLTTFFIILILLASIVTTLGVLVIRVAVQTYEQIYFPTKPKVSFKQQAKKRYERKYKRRPLNDKSKTN